MVLSIDVQSFFYFFLFRYMSIGDYAELKMYKVKQDSFESNPSVLCSETVRFTNFLHLLFAFLLIKTFVLPSLVICEIGT